MGVDVRRVRKLNEKPAGSGPVLYWMQRDLRVEDNWALFYAQERALERKVPLVVAFELIVVKNRANLRQYSFMLEGLRKVADRLLKYNISFFLLDTTQGESIGSFIKKHHIGEVVTDFSPLKNARKRRDRLTHEVLVGMSEVDAHNIIPCWLASDKEEFAAYTFRPKVGRQLETYLTKFPTLKKHPYNFISKAKTVSWEKLLSKLPLDKNVGPVSGIFPGEKAALATLKDFIRKRLPTYHLDRNNPNKSGVSGLSPYLHFGHISAQRVALEVSKVTNIPKEAKEAFLEELIVRRELADNYCFYNQTYDKFAGAHAWAKKSLREHKKDKREYVYTKTQFEAGETHDDLWNAMQMQMVSEGKMHGWCRMYWAKKILEWTPDVEKAIDVALYLNDKYELDGNDPSGIVGVMWSICGVHDRAWNERPIFGKVRFMNYAGAKRKFDIKNYIEKYSKEATLFKLEK